MMTDIEKFKHLLEYFVAHLEYVANNNKDTTVGYDTYIKPLVEKHAFKKQGQGHNKRHKIQLQVKDWYKYSNGHSIQININAASQIPYHNNACYLNWGKTWVNVRPSWNGDHIDKLYLTQAEKSSANSVDAKTIKELGLFDKETPNKTLNDFFDNYKNMLDNYIAKQKEQNMNEKIQEYVNLITSNHNLILTGAPGTGKTYLAKQIAKAMGCSENEIGFVQFHPSYDYTDFVEGLRPVIGDNQQIGFERKDGVFKIFCEQALKTLNGGQQITNFDDVYSLFVDDVSEEAPTLETPIQKRKFRLEVNRNRNFYAIPQTSKATRLPITKELIQVYLESGKAIDWKSYVPAIGDYIKSKYKLILNENTNNKNAKYVFIIDEINRGEISKIFGELFFAIDPGYRGSEKCSELRTQYANLQESSNEFDRTLNITEANNFGHFFVPENVYIIGTMNDIDRSVESMDFAFRRRFAFKEVTADDSKAMLDDLEWKDKAVKRMDSLNAAIEEIEGLSSAYHIGASYFLKLKNYNGDFSQLWDCHLKGLLFEYLRGTQSVDENMQKLEKAYNLTNTAADDSDTNN